ncbi:DUF4314 domain-containing protein [Staphylococcus xylosus]|uniref:DUF4314 domain-containing protein n=1 Tax=Staphylococcus TaxID=1279 RepID=UPI00367BFA66
MINIEKLKRELPEGTRIELIHINDDFCKLMKGDKGTVECVDDIGQIHVQFDDSIRIGLDIEEDSFVTI